MHSKKILEFGFQANNKLICSRCMEILVICYFKNPKSLFYLQFFFSFFEKLGLELDNLARSPKIENFTSIV